LDYKRASFNIGSVFDWTERKNPNALIKAYYNSFTGEEDVSLTIRTFWRFPIEKTRDYVHGQMGAIRESFKGRTLFPKVNFWLETMDDSIMPNFFKSFDCFVLPTRGEGFGLPLLESMACGVPTIGPAWGGNTEFMHNGNSFLIGGKVIPIADHVFLRLQPQYNGQCWFDMDQDHLAEAIKYVYKNREAANKIASVGAKEVAERFTWEIAADRIYRRLIEIEGEL
jgi:glycosyltransferase involved in cell wall biosynthesis